MWSEWTLSRRFSKKFALEAGKNLLITFLILSLLFLIGETGLFRGAYEASPLFREIGEFAQRLRGERTSGGDTGGVLLSEAAFPATMAITFEDGSRHAAKYSTRVRNIYERFKALLGEALGSAGEPEKITADIWREALGSSSVYFDFLYAQPLSVLSAWVGEGKNEGISVHKARRILIARDADSLALYYISEPDGEFFKSSTPLGYFSLESLIYNYSPNGVYFEYEDSKHNGLDPYFLFSSDILNLQSMEARPAATDFFETLLPVFGMNRYVARTTPLAGGGEEYVENDMRLELHPGGLLRFKSNSFSVLHPEDSSPSAAVESALKIASACLRPTDGRDHLNLHSLSYDAENHEYTVTFSYILAGLPVVYPDMDSAAQIKIKNGIVENAVIYAREYYPAQEQHKLLMPDRQQAGIVSHQGGGEPWLVYTDRGEAVVTAGWDLN